MTALDEIKDTSDPPPRPDRIVIRGPHGQIAVIELPPAPEPVEGWAGTIVVTWEAP
jgi:hypothetical protein